MEFKNSNDYSFTVFDAKNAFLYKKGFSHNVYKDTLWLSDSDKFRDWHYINVYARRTGRFLARYYKGGYVPQKPR